MGSEFKARVERATRLSSPSIKRQVLFIIIILLFWVARREMSKMTFTSARSFSSASTISEQSSPRQSERPFCFQYHQSLFCYSLALSVHQNGTRKDGNEIRGLEIFNLLDHSHCRIRLFQRSQTTAILGRLLSISKVSIVTKYKSQKTI